MEKFFWAKIKLIGFAALFMSATAHGSTEVQNAKVLYVGTYGSGRFFVALDSNINEPGCAHTRVDLPPTHPQIKNWLAVALTAISSGRTISLRTTGCMGVVPTMSQDESSFFYIQ